jgi:hypothetical protein
MLLTFCLVLGLPAALLILLIVSVHKSVQRATNYEVSVATAHKVVDVVSDGKITLGIDPKSKTLVIVDARGNGHRYTYDHVAAIELAAVFEREEEGTTETRTSRSSQLIGAGVGVALAGPVGLAVGGLSGKKISSHTTTSKERLDHLDLKLRLFCDDQPAVTVSAPAHAQVVAERLAARLANAIDQRMASRKKLSNPVAITTELFTNQQLAVAGDLDQRGWWAKTMGQ